MYRETCLIPTQEFRLTTTMMLWKRTDSCTKRQFLKEILAVSDSWFVLDLAWLCDDDGGSDV